jgi:hypothetical protein
MGPQELPLILKTVEGLPLKGSANSAKFEYWPNLSRSQCYKTFLRPEFMKVRNKFKCFNVCE